jgi:hypothetical protein
VSTIKLSNRHDPLAAANTSHNKLTGSSRAADADLCDVADSIIDDRNTTGTTAETACGAILKRGRASFVVLQEVDGTTIKV